MFSFPRKFTGIEPIFLFKDTDYMNQVSTIFICPVFLFISLKFTMVFHHVNATNFFLGGGLRGLGLGWLCSTVNELNMVTHYISWCTQ